jgi:hypothetical protein
MKDQKTGLRVDWGHLALLFVFCGVTVAYLLDARATSLKTNNLLLVQPGAILLLVLAAAVLPQCFRRGAPPAGDRPAPSEATFDERRARRLELAKVAALAAAFGAYVFSLETIGFDLATFLFTAFGLYVCGERRLWLIGLFSAIFTFLIVYGYQMLVPYPFPLTVL